MAFVRVFVCLSVDAKTVKLLIRNWCKLAGIYVIVNRRSDETVTPFDLDRRLCEPYWYF